MLLRQFLPLKLNSNRRSTDSLSPPLEFRYKHICIFNLP